MLLGVACALTLAAGCATPRVITQATSRDAEIKFAWSDGGDFGLVRCAIGDQGALADCKGINVQFND
ncbi:MAG: hypothetical protein AMXMBFR64_16150 [Myxococcales bacterium]